MQKHERECFDMAKTILEPKGFVLTHHHNGHAKMVITAVRKIGCREWEASHIVPSSPRSADNEVCYTRQWAKKIAVW